MRKHRTPVLSPMASVGITFTHKDNFSLPNVVEEVVYELTNTRASFTAWNVTQIIRGLFPTTMVPHNRAQGTAGCVRDLVHTCMCNDPYADTYETEYETVAGQDVTLYVPCTPKSRSHRKMDPALLDRAYNGWKYTTIQPIQLEPSYRSQLDFSTGSYQTLHIL